MTTSEQKPPLQTKGAKSERQKRLSSALRENLRKRKAQSKEREKTKVTEEEDETT
jgi:hypothetical protein